MSEEQQQPQETLADILKQSPAAPTQEKIESWKATYGDIYVSGFSKDELFIWRPVTRSEWINLQEMAADPKSGINNFRFEEMLCETVTLWKSIPGSWDKGKAGTPSSLNEQILQNSNFLTPQAASMLVMKL